MGGSAPALRGTPASGGRASGPVFLVPEATAGGTGPAEPPAEPEAVERAADAAADRLVQLAQERAGTAQSAAAILEAQAMMLRDPSLLSGVRDRLAAGSSVEEAVLGAAEAFAQQLEAVGDEYLRQRAADVRDVGRLLLTELRGGTASRLDGLTAPAVVIAHDLTPADTLSVDPALLLAVVTETGGPTSHAAIIARELGIPAVVQVAGALDASRGAPGATVDGTAGEVRFVGTADVVSDRRGGRLELGALPLPLRANAGSVPAVQAAADAGALGVGLLRTEFLFLGRDEPVSEDEQAAIYAAACRAMAPHPVVVRTLDIGFDKPLPYVPPERTEPNPALGQRGVRLWLAHDELWRPQVAALVRVGAEHPNLDVMIPMVATRAEMVDVGARFQEAAGRLGVAPPRLGMMVELPAAAVALDRFADVAAFVSLGTNDLTQYALGADREVDWGVELTEYNPGVLALLAGAIEGAHRAGLEVGVCGELAGQPEGATFLTGAGADYLSMAAGGLGPVADVLGRRDLDRCRAAAQEALRARDAEGALRVLREER
jgi:phosphoenolpyruvate-protein kinase (PTS system EI component)